MSDPSSVVRSLSADKQACAEVIQAWGLYRDQGRWDDLLGTFTPDGEIAVSWFRGRFPDFVERCKQNAAARTSQAKHLLWPSVVHVTGDRAVAETNVAILVRQTIEGVLVDLTSYGRFLDRLQRRERWLIVERVTIYEHDRLDPVQPSQAFTAMMQGADVAKYPAAYRYMAYRVVAAGRSLAEPVHSDGTVETDALYARYNAWRQGQ
jgi:hypothetical protein